MLTQELVKTIIHYDPETGVITFLDKNRPSPRILKGNYVYMNILNKRQYGHRLAWIYMTGDYPKGNIDHINHEPSDNRWCNLRDCSQSENLQNKGMMSNNKSGIRGVCWNNYEQKWHANITIDNKQKHLGYFSVLADAAEAYRLAVLKFHSTNPIQTPSKEHLVQP